VVVRSTVLPGTVEGRVLPILERAVGRRAGETYGVSMNPEFLREGTSILDFNEPPKIVIGQLDDRSGDVVARTYEGIDAPMVRTAIRTAEMVKYADNAFHALKIGFANEIGNVCKAAGVDGRQVMEIFRLDTKLNISGAYLKPGGAFGGSCLPKDLRALVYHARAKDVRLPMLGAILPSNDEQKRIAFEMVRRTGKRRIGLLGLSFKPDTDDLRESPAVELAEALIGKGYDLSIYDRNVAVARLVGSNRAYIEHGIPHVSSLMHDSISAVIERSDVLVVMTRDPEFGEALRSARADQLVLDLVGIVAPDTIAAQYEGVCW
jgi:GDP-mannose 6-dehydrogenase